MSRWHPFYPCHYVASGWAWARRDGGCGCRDAIPPSGILRNRDSIRDAVEAHPLPPSAVKTSPEKPNQEPSP